MMIYKPDIEARTPKHLGVLLQAEQQVLLDLPSNLFNARAHVNPALSRIQLKEILHGIPKMLPLASVCSPRSVGKSPKKTLTSHSFLMIFFIPFWYTQAHLLSMNRFLHCWYAELATGSTYLIVIGY